MSSRILKSSTYTLICNTTAFHCCYTIHVVLDFSSYFLHDYNVRGSLGLVPGGGGSAGLIPGGGGGVDLFPGGGGGLVLVQDGAGG